MSGPIGEPQGGEIRARRVHRGIALVLLAGLVVTIPALYNRDLWNPDEPRYAEVARGMIVSGDYLVPQLNSEIYAEKPPLVFWAAALLQRAGAGFEAGRIVTGLAVLALLLLTGAIARLATDDEGAVLAPLVLVTSLMMLAIGKAGVLDVPLALFTTLAAWGLFRHQRQGGASIVLFYVGMGLATLTKGPVGILIPVLAAVASLGSTSPPRKLPRHVLWGVPLTAVIVGAWLVPALVSGGAEYAQTILFRQNVGRMVESWSHRKPWYYYAGSLPMALLPWSVFLPAAAALAWRAKPDRRGGAPRQLLLWAMLSLALFSLVSGKRGRYLVPLLPGLSILVAHWFRHAASSEAGSFARRHTRHLLRVNLVLLGVAALAVLGLLAAAPLLSARLSAERPEAAEVLERLLAPSSAAILALVGLALLGWVGRSFRRLGRDGLAHGFAAVVLGMLLLSVGFDLALAPAIDLVKSPREVAQMANRLAPPGGDVPLALYPQNYSGSYHLYSGRMHIPVLHAPEEVDRFLTQEPQGVVLTTRRSYEEIDDRLVAPHEVVDVARVGHREIIFLVSRHPAGTGEVPSGPADSAGIARW